MSKMLGWSDKAKEDLEEIFEFYFFKNPQLAARIHDGILDEAERLIEWPEVGQIEDELVRFNLEYPFRRLVTRNGLFKLIYYIVDDSVIISRVWCCRKDPLDFE
ncbi:type II toxin-antitoxin system RelE/ParE family toxin [Bacteroides sp. 519]|uniref:type II toxin-antitoxin system RelE/ParE family toxin n=1 Tax=Bacteroides sp. 519 TaxID=2302937 RepID=UPI0013D586B6|nr:type II toxin-antitoxin system RelE/ParE family toxin [Bacteroides sp. 519]NDV57715.1 type II toxin-antitoxin system RelE/ParE family toxin [Bacteroides sp. 519]